MVMTTRTPAEYLRQARELLASPAAQPHHLGVLASFTLAPLAPYLVVESAEMGRLTDVWTGPFNQFEEQVLDEGSPLWAQPLDALWLALRVDDALPTLVDDHPAAGAAQTAERLQALVERLASLARQVRQRSTMPIFVSNWCWPDLLSRHPFDASDPEGIGVLLADANRALARAIRAIPDAYIFDYAGVVAAQGTATWTDARTWYAARMGVAAAHLPALARWLARTLSGATQPRAKCLVVDLDNTLWGGVLGDDGLEGIRLGHDYPGNVYRALQQALLGYRARGIVLAVASKNDESVVRHALDTHPEMLLRPQHFAAIYANWEPKPVNLRRIADDLNIGLDSLIFLDDNPVERAQVRAELPMVRIVELPTDITGYLPALRAVAELDTPRVLDEDRDRAAMYAREKQRAHQAQTAESIEDFLEGLGMQAQVGRADERTLERVHQLINKTNQFNLTTRRYLLEEVRELAASPEARVLWLRLADRYGDMGLVCVGILRHDDATCWSIDTLLMSCRVMGRQVETAFLAYLEEVAQQAGAATLRAHYAPTAKNGVVADLYDRHGYERETVGEDGVVYSKHLPAAALAWPSRITRHESEVQTLHG